MNPALLHKEVQDYITENFDKEIAQLSLQGSPFEDVSTQELAVQLIGKKKAQKKLPSWFNTTGVLYPPSLNLEQTSSEKTAAYKASFTKGKRMADLTGGFGVDSYYFSKNFDELVHCELNASLSELVAHNAGLLGVTNMEAYEGDGIEYLRESEQDFDWIFIDPSRRDDAGGRVFQLSDCLPDVPEHLDLLLQKGKRVLMKTSPLLDLQSGIRSLKQKVKEIHIVAVKNEVKELLWFLEKDTFEEVTIKTINFKESGNEQYENLFQKQIEIAYGSPLKYLYEPNAAILKSGLFTSIAADFGLTKLHPNSHLYTSEELVSFPGRTFEILQTLPYSRKRLKRSLKFTKAHLSTRNFPESVANLRKLLKLQDGGEHYLFFTTTQPSDKIVLICKKLKKE